MSLKDLGNHIKQARAEHRYTAAELAQRLGVNPKTVSAIENGTSVPRAGTQNRLEEIFGWAPGTITAIIEDTPPPLARVASAADLSDEELVAEVTFRLLSRNRNVAKTGVSDNDETSNQDQRTSSTRLPPPLLKDGVALAARKRHEHDR